MLALVDCESHYAVYRPGAGYARHLDCLRGNDARVISAVFYLNDDWLDADGGALRLYLADGSTRDTYPRAGSLLLFLSARFEHEVLPASRDRMSIACWMRQRAMVVSVPGRPSQQFDFGYRRRRPRRSPPGAGGSACNGRGD